MEALFCFSKLIMAYENSVRVISDTRSSANCSHFLVFPLLEILQDAFCDFLKNNKVSTTST